MAAMEAANAHYHSGHQQQGPPLPASPTLTNPDMILPDYDRSDSPDPDLGSSQHASVMMWKNPNNSTSAPDMHQMFVATGITGPRPYGPSGPITPTTPIIYGNGTLLSDIGEVTEVESTVGKPSPGRTKSSSRRSGSTTPEGGNGAASRSTPTITNAAMLKKKSKRSVNPKHERRSSIESTSTITNGDHAAAFADFDDSVSVGDSVFQGDDEQSMASSYTEGTPAVEPARLGVAKGDNTDRLSTYSTTSLSRRAEEILANAKKRLTTMEGNLNRARSSLYYNAPYGSDGSTPSPPYQRASSAMYPAATGAEPSTPPASHTQGHTRMSSDIAMRNGLPYRVSVPRSQSALGAAGGYRQPLTASKSADHIRGNVEVESHRSVHRTSLIREAGLKPLTEDEVARLGEADSESQKARLEAFLSPPLDSPSYGSFHNDSGTRYFQRSSSAAQMRDIKDIKEQMRDLKGKISSLREQARADSLKRRSLQSLRTPSPFTHSQFDHWHAEPPSNRASVVIAGNSAYRNPWNGEESSVDGDARNAAQWLDNGYAAEGDTDYAVAEERLDLARADGPRPLPPSTPVVATDGGEEEDVSDMQTENGDVDDEQEDTEQEEDTFHDAEDADYMSESGESLYHDTVQHQISHEDREDAFDYGHFFLHSAMGTMSLERRSSTDSYTSEDSVETTRGPVASGTSSDEQRPMVGRRNSSNSISTIDTFTTANEGRSLKSPVGSDEHYSACEPSSRATSAQSHRHRSGSTATAKRLSLTSGTLHPPTSGSATRDSDGSISPIAEESSAAGSPAHQPSSSRAASRRASVVLRPISAAAATHDPVHHRPSISSFDSVGTNRSFPLVNKTRSSEGVRKASSTGVLTPRDSPSPSSSAPVPSPGKQGQPSELGTIASRLLSGVEQHAITEAAKGEAADGANGMSDGEAGNIGAPRPLEALLREDKYLVDRIVACLGRCVLGLTENGRASAESRMYRRRLDAARRVLEGLDAV
ncbi:hypothetical protein VTG60DRAFT_3552 [Thermothelomyces hinnuleus]